jgi:hypothetical protein
MWEANSHPSHPPPRRYKEWKGCRSHNSPSPVNKGRSNASTTKNCSGSRRGSCSREDGSDSPDPKTGEKRARDEEDEEEQELQRRAKALLDKRRAEREAAQAQKEGGAAQQPKSTLASKALAIGLTPPKPKEAAFPLERGHISETAKLKALLVAEPGRERRQQGKMMSAAWEKEAKAAIGSPKGGRKPLPEAEARALARQQQGATRSEERTPGTSPKSPGRKQPPKPTPPPRSPATPKPPASPRSPESPSRREEQLHLLRKRFNAIELNVATLRSMGWEAGEEFPDTAHGDMQAMRAHRASLRNMAEWDLYDIGPQYVDDRDAMVASLGRQLDMLDAHADINREERVQGKPIRSRIPRKEIIERVDRVRELARQRQERQERERENKRQKELRLARQRRQAKEEEDRRQAKEAARRTEEERKRKALLGEPKRKRSRAAKAPGGSEPSSSDSEEEAPQGPEDMPPASPGKSPSDTPPRQPRPPLFKKPAKLPRREPSPKEGGCSKVHLRCDHGWMHWQDQAGTNCTRIRSTTSQWTSQPSKGGCLCHRSSTDPCSPS